MTKIDEMQNLVENLNVKGSQDFMGKEIPVIEGGFGEGQKVMLAKTIAEIHNTRPLDVNALINNHKDEFENEIDILDLKNEKYKNFANVLVVSGLITQNSFNASKNVYLLSEQGYMLLAGFMEGEKAKEIRKKLRREYFSMREQIRQQPQLSAENQAILDIVNATDKTETALAVKNFKEIITKPLNETIQIQADVIEEMKPAVVVKETLESSKDAILVGELAKILKQNGINIGQNRLFEWMRDKGYLIKRKGTDYNMPTQKSMELGLFEIKETNIVHSNGEVRTKKTTKVTGKGQVYFINKFIKPKETKLTKSLQGVIECTQRQSTSI